MANRACLARCTLRSHSTHTGGAAGSRFQRTEPRISSTNRVPSDVSAPESSRVSIASPVWARHCRIGARRRRPPCRRALLAHPPDVRDGQVRVGAVQEPVDPALAFSPRGGKEAVVGCGRRGRRGRGPHPSFACWNSWMSSQARRPARPAATRRRPRTPAVVPRARFGRPGRPPAGSAWSGPQPAPGRTPVLRSISCHAACNSRSHRAASASVSRGAAGHGPQSRYGSVSSRATRKRPACSTRTGCHSPDLLFPGTASARDVPASSAARSRVQQESPTRMMTALLITLTRASHGSPSARPRPPSGPRRSRPSVGR